MNVHAPQAATSRMSDEEWQVRCDLAALYRLVAHYKMTDWIYTHISARLPGPDHHFLINQYGVLFEEMTASDLVKIDLDGNIIEEAHHAGMSPRQVNAAGFCIHSAIHMARHDIMCVIHTHTAAGIAVSAQKRGLMPISQHALKFYGHLAYHGYEGIALDLDERDRLVHDLGEHRAMILRNHGLLAGGGRSRRRSTRSITSSGHARRRWRAAMPSWSSRRRRSASIRRSSSTGRVRCRIPRWRGSRRCA